MKQILVSEELLLKIEESLESRCGTNAPERREILPQLRELLEQPAAEPVAKVIWPSVPEMPSIEWVTAGMALFAAPQAQQPQLLTDEEIRSIHLANGFTVKEGQSDLKPYVFASARAVEQAVLQKNGF